MKTAREREREWERQTDREREWKSLNDWKRLLHDDKREIKIKRLKTIKGRKWERKNEGMRHGDRDRERKRIGKS